MKKTNNNEQSAKAIFETAQAVHTYTKPAGTKAEQKQPAYSQTKRGAMLLIDAELRGFNANIRALKANANLPALIELMNADCLTFDMFNIDYLKQWQKHRFNSAGALCNLIKVTEANAEVLAECEQYENNGTKVAKKPASAWSATAFYNMFKAARRAELKHYRDEAKARAKAEADALNAVRLRAQLAKLQQRVNALDVEKSE